MIFIIVGGIYTVIRSKAYVSTEEMGDQFCLIGPYKEHCARTEVEDCDFTNPALCEAVESLRHKGFKVIFISLPPLPHQLCNLISGAHR